MSAPTILLSCGEASGEVYAVGVARALRERWPELRLVGIGGDALEAEGVELWTRRSQLEVMGFAEVVRHLPRLRRLRNELRDRALRERVDLFLPVDYPGFHISLASALGATGIPTLDLIPPKTWSWGSWRLRSLRRSVERCAVIFPFEEAYYRSHGVRADFVGHPLAARFPRPEAESPRSGLLLVPGSRQQELTRIAPTLAEAAARLVEAGMVEAVRVSQAPGVDRAWLAPILDGVPGVRVVEGELAPALLSAAAAMVTSGTASLEAALAGVPHAIVYHTSAVSYWIARRLVTVRHIGMANIVLDRAVWPEFLQGELRSAPLAATVADLLTPGSAEAARQKAASLELHRHLAGGGWAARVAGLAAEVLEGRQPPR